MRRTSVADLRGLGALLANRPAHTDPQLQEAVPPQVLCSGGLQR